MSVWTLLDELRCPRCGYDVSTTLDDGFDICPECGSAISRDTCRPGETKLSPRDSRVLLAFYSTPSVTFILVGIPITGSSTRAGLVLALVPIDVATLLLGFVLPIAGSFWTKRKYRGHLTVWQLVIPLFWTYVLTLAAIPFLVLTGLFGLLR